MVELAYFGGQPVRENQKIAQPFVSEEAKHEVKEVLDSRVLNRFYGGAKVQEFEKLFAERFQRRFAVATNSGTSALHLAFLGARLPEFSEVVVPASSFVSVASALIQANLVPIPVDILPDTWMMDPDDLERKISSRTSAIVAVHMVGQVCDMHRIMQIAQSRGLFVFEDCAQSFGALSGGTVCGTFGEIVTYSLCCRKHVVCGEGGIVLTDSEEVYDYIRALVHKGKGEGWFDHLYMGYSYGMPEVQAVVAKHSLSNFENDLSSRQSNAQLLIDGLKCSGLDFPVIPEGSTHAYHKFDVCVPVELKEFRNEIVDAIKAEGVGAEPAHPYLLEIDWLREQRPTLYRVLDSLSIPRPSYDKGMCPIGRDVLSRQIGLGVGPCLDADDMRVTIDAVSKVMSHYLRTVQAV